MGESESRAVSNMLAILDENTLKNTYFWFSYLKIACTIRKILKNAENTKKIISHLRSYNSTIWDI